MHDPTEDEPRGFLRRRRRPESFPWITSVVCAAVITASQSPSGIRDALANLFLNWLLLLFVAFLASVLFLDALIDYVVKDADPDEVIYGGRVLQVVMLFAVLVLWGGPSPTDLPPGDPGDRYP